MAYNPFLSMNEPVAPVTTDILNPFMISESETSNYSPGDNPFATSNPFSDFGNSYEPPAGDTVPVDIFGGAEPTDGGAKQFVESGSMNIFGNVSVDNEKLVKPTELELVSNMVDCSYPNEEESKDIQTSTRPLPPETQNLILTVTGQMEFTSTHLLDRIPPTRTPSPVSALDIHSPSPTPEPELLEEPTTTIDVNRNKPARPPPARPPRPAPPPRPQAPPQIAADDINLFDAPAPVTIKPTKEAILSLYSAPKQEEKPIDFLSDDIPELPTETEMKPTDVFSTAVTNASESSNLFFTETDQNVTEAIENEAQKEIPTMPVTTNNSDNEVTPMDCTEPAPEINNASVNVSPFADITDNSYHLQQVSESEKNPFEFTDTMENSDQQPDAASEKFKDVVMTSINDTPFTSSETFTTVPQTNVVEAPLDVFGSTSNDAFEDTQTTNIFSTGQDNAIDVPTTSATDLGWDTADTMAQDIFPESQDAFDAFSAKFDSTSANHMNTGK